MIRASSVCEPDRPFIFQLPATSGRRSAPAMSNPAFFEPSRAGSRAAARTPDRAGGLEPLRRPCGLWRGPCEEGCPLGLARKGGACLLPVFCLPTVFGPPEEIE